MVANSRVSPSLSGPRPHSCFLPKTEFICEKYLFVIENYILRILMTKLRLGILNLEIVLGRYEGFPRE